MAEFLWDYNLVTPIIVETVAHPASRGTGDAELVGTGTYLRCHGASYLVTAKHVADRASEGIIQHLPVRDDTYVPFDGPFMSAEFPLDFALARVQSEYSVRADALDTAYCPAPEELLFILGFPGSTARRTEVVTGYNKRRAVLDTFPTEGFQYITQTKTPQPPQRDDFDPRIHIAICYPANAQKKPASPPRDLPRPDGLSGSLLWDTKRVAAERNGATWSPDMARVCGMVHHDFDISEFLSATKIEYIRACLLSLIRRERAYLRWISRGQLAGDALADWAWSEQTIADLDCE